MRRKFVHYGIGALFGLGILLTVVAGIALVVTKHLLQDASPLDPSTSNLRMLYAALYAVVVVGVVGLPAAAVTASRSTRL